MEDWDETSRRRSVIWSKFSHLGDYNAKCNKCKNVYSYRTSTSNLTKHWRRCSQRNIDGDHTTDCSDEEWSNNSDELKQNNAEDVKKESKSTWQYFDVVEDDKFAAKCKVCEKEVPFDSISDLREHAREHDAVLSDDEDWGESKDTSIKIYEKKKRVNSSKVWRFMKVTDERRRIAMCMMCKKQLCFMSSISNLTKHMRRAHSHVNLEEDLPDVNSKKVLISANGQLYEVETSDGEKDPIQTEEIYDYESLDADLFNTIQSKISPKIPKKEEKPKKRKILTKELLNKTPKNNDSDEDTSKKTRYNTSKIQTSISPSKMDSLDYFAQYVVSLLRQLPKHVSDQLQSDMIKQIFAAKISHETTYSVTLNTKPITVTLNNGISESMPEITVHKTSEDVKSDLRC